MPRPVHFEIHVENIERAKAFYAKLFGWGFTRMGGPTEYWLIKTGADGTHGINGGMLKRPCPVEGNGCMAYVCTIDVPNLDVSLKTALATGGIMAMDKMPIPGVGWLAYCKDPEGNVFGMMQMDPAAK